MEMERVQALSRAEVLERLVSSDVVVSNHRCQPIKRWPKNGVGVGGDGGGRRVAVLTIAIGVMGGEGLGQGKVAAFSWRSILDRIPTAFNLQKRGISLANDSNICLVWSANCSIR